MSADKVPVTVLVLCGNEEKYIASCLETATWADEILVVVDASSTDRTEEVARQYTNRVLRHYYENYATQQNWSIPQARNEWVLVLDSDERITPKLRDEVTALLRNGPNQDGYWIVRRNYLFGKHIRHSGWGGDRVLRLFRRDLTRYKIKRVHSKADIARTGRIGGEFIHYSINSTQGWVDKVNRYSTWKSVDKFERNTPLPLIQMILRPPLRFLKDYLLRLGILDGSHGFMIAAMSAFTEFLVSAKVIEQRWQRDAAASREKNG